MIPILYAPTEASFTSNGLGGLADATECIVHEQRNGCFEMTLVMPTTGQHFADIQKGSYIKALPSPTGTAQLFEVVSIEKSMDDMMAEVYCQHVAYRLNRIPVTPYTANSAWYALQGLSTYAAETNPFTFYTDVTRAGTYNHKIPSSAKACMQGEAGSILQVYQGEYKFDNWTINLLANRGIDRGVSIRYGKNLIDLDMEESIEGVVTGILPYWIGKSGQTDVVMMLPEYVVYSSHASDFPNARTECIDFSEDFEQQPTEAQLRTAANDYITNNNIGVPIVDWDVEFATLAQTTEYSSIALLERMDLCDIVTIVFDDFGINTQAKIVEIYFDVLKERYTKVHIGDQRFTLAETIANTSAQIEQSEAKTTNWFQQALDQATALLNGDLTGASMTTQTDANGNPIGLIFMDTNDPSTAVNCIQINANGIGFSSQGIGGPYNSAWTIGNTLDMSQINVIHLNASAIDAGTISADRISGGTLTGITAEFGQSTQQGYPAIKIFSSGVLQMYSGATASLRDTKIYGLDYWYTRTGKTTNVAADVTWYVSDEETNPNANYNYQISGFANKIKGEVNGENRLWLEAGQYGGKISLYAKTANSLIAAGRETFRFDAEQNEMVMFNRANGNREFDVIKGSTIGGVMTLYDQNGEIAVMLDRTGLQFYQNGSLVKTYGPNGMS